jgi:flagellar hook-length control protein FliK
VKDYQLKETVLKQVSAQLDKLETGQSQLRIELEPKNLGKLEIALTTHEGRLIAHLLANNSDVKDVIAANLQSFHDALSQKGIQVQELSVAVRADVGGQSQGRGFDAQPWMFRQASGSAGNQEDLPTSMRFGSISDSQAQSSFSVLV